MLLTAVGVDEGIRFPLACLKIQSILKKIIGQFKKDRKKMPLKDLLILKRLRRGDLKSFSPHSTPHFSAWFFQQKNRR
jgi:hypothetical protein